MAFTTALSGLTAASNNLAVTGNNIANANTSGFKKSRSEFADVYASSIGGVGTTTPGAGVKVANVAQQFQQGSLNFTGNNLDLAISGEGFFTLGKSPTESNDLSYTRAGEFKLDKDGFLVNNQGRSLLVYKPNGPTVADGFSTGVTTPVQINTLTGLPKPTDVVNLTVNLDSSAVEASAAAATPVANPFDPANPNNTTNNGRTSVTVYDSLGSPHILTTFFVKEAASQWSVYHYLSEPNSTTLTQVDAGGTPATLQFGADGRLDPTGTSLYNLNTEAYPLLNGASPIDIANMNYTGSTQVQQKFSVNDMNQNGLPAGNLTGIDIDNAGVIFARFSNGGAQTMGKVALSRFPNNNGLAKLGDTTWGQSANSGEPIRGEAGANNFGSIQSGALESSNVDLSAQLVNLIVAQQAYQANAQTITTENTIMQTILQIR